MSETSIVPILIEDENTGEQVESCNTIPEAFRLLKNGTVGPGKYEILRRMRVGIEVSAPVTRTKVTRGTGLIRKPGAGRKKKETSDEKAPF